MNSEQTKKLFTNGAFLSLAFTSIFLLNFKEEGWREVLRFILIFGIYSGTIIWVKQYQKTLPDNKIKLNQVVGFVFKLFFVAALFSSILKYYFFAYLKPSAFTFFVEQQKLILEIYNENLRIGLKDALKEKNQTLIWFYQYNIANLPDLKAFYVNIYYIPVVTFLQNIIASIFLSWFIWPLFKFSQQKPTPINQ